MTLPPTRDCQLLKSIVLLKLLLFWPVLLNKFWNTFRGVPSVVLIHFSERSKCLSFRNIFCSEVANLLFTKCTHLFTSFKLLFNWRFFRTFSMQQEPLTCTTFWCNGNLYPPGTGVVPCKVSICGALECEIGELNSRTVLYPNRSTV